MADKLPSLNVLSGPLAGHKFVIEDAVDNILIGSDSSCGFVLDTPGVSPIHARLWVDLNGATVYDTNSPNGVYVNDDRVVKEAPVRNGDILWLGPPGAEGSVLIQCILPVGAAAAKAEAEDSDSEVDTSAATLGFAVPTIDEPEPPSGSSPSFTGNDYEDSDVDSTVVMTSSAPMGSPIERQPLEPEPDPSDATMLLDAADSLDPVDETVSMPPPMPPPVPMRAQPAPPPPEPVDDVVGFPDFEVEPTVMMPPPLPPKATPPPAPPPAPVAEFEDELEPTMVDAPRPGGRLPAPVPDHDLGEDESTSTVMFRAGEAPPPMPPPAAAPPAPAPPPRAVTPKPTEAPAAPPARPAAPAPKPAAPAATARPPAEAKPAPRAAAPAPAPAVTARPAAPPVRARAPERPAPAPPVAAAPAPSAPRGGGSSKAPLIAAGAVVVAALAFAAYWFTRSAPPEVAVATPAPVAPPETQAAPPTTQAAAPVITEEPPVTVAAAPPETVAPVVSTTPPPTARSPLPSPSPRLAAATPKPGTVPPGQRPPAATPPPVNAAQQTAATVANLMGQAKTASDAKNYDAAVSMYDEVLKLDPQNGPATTGRTAALSAKNASRRTFVSSRTVVQTEQKSKGPAGFDTSDVSVKSQDFVGRLEFAMNPATVKPGEAYKLQVALVNEGKKAIKISGMTFTVTVNGQKSGNPIAPKVKEVAPAQRVVLEELPGVFPESVNTWTAEVLVTANKGDSLRNQITWK